MAEDIVQEIFINIWESNKQYNSINGFKAYLYEAVSNRCADYWKHRAVEEKYTAHVLYEQKLPDFSVQEEEILRELYAAIGELPQRSQEVILLSLEGKKNQEIAQLLNLSVLTIKTHKKNAFRYLKNRLQNLVLLVMIMQISKKDILPSCSG
ncbi:MAG: RNA polymerase sigma factor [Odoribacter splanchnicus]